MVRANGDALVMHVGEKPIVVAGSRTIDLSGHGLPLGAMVGMLGQLLPAEARAALEEFGAVEHRLPDRGDDRFSVVAARGGRTSGSRFAGAAGPVAVVESSAADEPRSSADAAPSEPEATETIASPPAESTIAPPPADPEAPAPGRSPLGG